MRAILHGDIVTVARALLSFDTADRAAVVERLLCEAHAADKYRKNTGQAHKMWGNGTLAAAARHYPVIQEPFLGDPAYCACMIVVYQAILDWRFARYPCAHSMQVGAVGSKSRRLRAMSAPHLRQ